MITLLQLFGYFITVFLLWPGGNWAVRFLLNRCGVQKQPPTPTPGGHLAAAEEARAGRIIGLLERSLILAGLLMKSWEVITAVIALKTVARYKELDRQITAEYFLIGSLASILWALVVAVIVSRYDATLGFHLFSHISTASDHNRLLQFISAEARHI